MGKLAGLILIATGVGTAAYVYPMFGSSNDRSDKQLADVVAITTGAVPATQPQLTRQPTVVVKPATQDSQRVVSAQPTPGRLPLTNEKPAAIASVLAVPVNEAKPIDVPQPVAGKKPSKSEDEARTALTRDIQRELKRVGCFEGSADGMWTPETRQGMKQFIDRVNASLPVEGPDHILKTLVQGHPGGACGRSCPTGQALSGDSKCVPTAIIAVPKRSTGTREAAVTQPFAVAPATNGAVPQPVTKASSWEPRIVPAPAPVVVQKAEPRAQVATIPEPRPEPRPADVKIERAEPLPGRTSLGATGVPPSSAASAPVTEAPSEPKPKRPVIVVRPSQDRDNAAAALPNPPERSAPKPAPSIGAVTAIEAPEKPRPVVKSPPAVAYRPPPQQRFVSSAPPPQVFRDRPRFGPQIFRELERGGR